MDTLRSVIDQQIERENELEDKYPWVPIYTKRLICFALAFLFVYAVIARIGKAINDRDEKIASDAIDNYAAAQQAVADEEQRKKDEEAKKLSNLMDLETVDCAKTLEGIKNFFGKYNYTERDARTYLRSAFNRVDALGITDPVERQEKLHEILFSGEYLAAKETNTVKADFKAISEKYVKEWHEEKTKPCDFEFQFAELLPDGIYLTKIPGADGYARRWQES